MDEFELKIKKERLAAAACRDRPAMGVRCFWRTGIDGAAACAYDRGRQRLAARGAEGGAAASVGDRRTTGRAGRELEFAGPICYSSTRIIFLARPLPCCCTSNGKAYEYLVCK
ncbi:hypothetical protein [Paenibacillus dendritiformis]|uniref:hypothetical protein n=1 Tax=Paenibacillus dendritiformis TaxID=130049 RepID=UPI0018CD3F32|nr:hypothetical protein [Paenibacillus dendritiformis]